MSDKSAPPSAIASAPTSPSPSPSTSAFVAPSAPPAAAEPALTDRQRRFVEEYLVDCNATLAAGRAGYSARSARQAGARLRAAPHVRRAVEAAMAARSDRLGVSQDRVVLELARLAFADMRDFASWGDGGVRLRPSEELTEDQAACVSEIVETPGKGVRVKLYGKTQALSALARHLGSRPAAGEAEAVRQVTVVTCVPFPELLPEEDVAGPQGATDEAGEAER